MLTQALASAATDAPLADVMRRVAARVRAASRNLGSEHRPQLEADAPLTVGDVFPRAR